MRTPVLLLGCLVVLAGCISVPEDLEAASRLAAGASPTAGVLHRADALLASLAESGMAPAVGAQFPHGFSAPEPTIGVTSDGTLFMTGMAPGGVRGGPTVYRSTDQGQTWEDKGPKLPTGDALPPNTNDPYVYVDPATDRVFMLDLHALVCSTLSWSDDKGETWTFNPIGCGHPVGVHDHQTIVAATPRGALPTVGYPNVVYYCVNRVVDSACATSLNGGLAFGPLITVFPGAKANDICGGLTGHLEAAPDGTVYLARGYCGVAMVAVTKDDGLTWSTHVISSKLAPDDHDVDLAVDEAGNVYAFWQSDYRFWLAHSTDQGATWSEPRDVTAPGVTGGGFFYAVAAGKPGHVAFAYVATTVEGGYEGKPMGTGGLLGQVFGEPDPEEWADATWHAYIGVMVDALGADPVIQTVTANDPADPIARGLCGGTRCHGMTDFIDIQIGPDGRPWASFVDVCTQECVTDPSVRWDKAVGFAGTLLRGPSLRGETTTLAEILPPPLKE